MAFNPSNLGRDFETRIAESQEGVVLTKVPTSVKYARGGHVIPITTPVDFFGGHIASGKLLVFDAKQSQHLFRLRTDESHLGEHQRSELCRFGAAGFIAGLLCEQSVRSEIYWCDWRLLNPRTCSVEWNHMHFLGRSAQGIRWDKIIEFAREMGEQDRMRAACGGRVTL